MADTEEDVCSVPPRWRTSRPRLRRASVRNRRWSSEPRSSRDRCHWCARLWNLQLMASSSPIKERSPTSTTDIVEMWQVQSELVDNAIIALS